MSNIKKESHQHKHDFYFDRLFSEPDSVTWKGLNQKDIENLPNSYLL